MFSGTYLIRNPEVIETPIGAGFRGIYKVEGGNWQGREGHFWFEHLDLIEPIEEQLELGTA